MVGVGGELRQQAVGGVEFRGVGGGVDGEHHGVETGARDVVRVPVAGPVGRVVMCREDQPGPYRIARVVHGEDGRTRGGGVAHLGVGVVLQGRAQPQGAYISSSKPRTSTRRASPRAPAMRAAMAGRAGSRVARWAGVKPCRPPSGTPAGHRRSTRVQGRRPGAGVADEASAAGPAASAATGPAFSCPPAASGSDSCAATSAWPFSRTPSGRVTVPEPRATRSTRAPISAANSASRPRSSGDLMSTRATMTYRLRG